MWLFPCNLSMRFIYSWEHFNFTGLNQKTFQTKDSISQHLSQIERNIQLNANIQWAVSIYDYNIQISRFFLIATNQKSNKKPLESGLILQCPALFSN